MKSKTKKAVSNQPCEWSSVCSVWLELAIASSRRLWARCVKVAVCRIKQDESISGLRWDASGWATHEGPACEGCGSSKVEAHVAIVERAIYLVKAGNCGTQEKEENRDGRSHSEL